MSNFALECTAFQNGAEIPKKHGYKHGNSSPPLKISGVPQNAKSLALIMDDPDAKAAVGRLWVHWVMWNIDPNTSDIREASNPPNSVQGKNDFGELGYGGPAPPDKKHTYIFKLYALDTKLNLVEGSTKTQLENAMKGHILSETTLKGTYAPQ